MAQLKQAVDMGYGNTFFFRTESALTALREREGFQTLMKDLAQSEEFTSDAGKPPTPE